MRIIVIINVREANGAIGHWYKRDPIELDGMPRIGETLSVKGERDSYVGTVYAVWWRHDGRAEVSFEDVEGPIDHSHIDPDWHWLFDHRDEEAPENS